MSWQRTVLYEQHLALGAKMVEFGGWEMPVQYSGILAEHRAVRKTVGLFDVSHMGVLELKGSGTYEFLQKVLTNDLAKLKPGRILYSLLCNQAGGCLDDLLVYQLAQEHYWLVVNAGNKTKDLAWLNEQADSGVVMRDLYGEKGLLALQGPQAMAILEQLFALSLAELKPFYFKNMEIENKAILISRTGYTGEDGYELYLAVENLPWLWTRLLEVPEVVPAGLGARDTLRFEACLPLYGQELTAEITPLEAGLEFCVAWSKKDFKGKAALGKQKEEGVKRKLVGFKILERGIPRTDYPLEKEGKSIGWVTSGNYAPTLEENLGLGYVSREEAFLGNEISVVIRGKKIKAQIIKKPFYRMGGQ